MVVATRLGYVAPKKPWWKDEVPDDKLTNLLQQVMKMNSAKLGISRNCLPRMEPKPPFKPIDPGSLFPVEAGWSSRLPKWGFLQGEMGRLIKRHGSSIQKTSKFWKQKDGFCFDHRWDVREDQYGNIEEEHQLPSNFEMEASERSELKSYPLVNVYIAIENHHFE